MTVRVYLTDGDSVTFHGVTETRAGRIYYEVQHANYAGTSLFPWASIRTIVETY